MSTSVQAPAGSASSRRDSGSALPVAETRELGPGPSPESVFRTLAARPGVFFIDSAGGPERMARWSFLGAEPFLVMEATGRRVVMTDARLSACDAQAGCSARNGDSPPFPAAAGARSADPFAALRDVLRSYRLAPSEGPVPFTAGAVGFFGYDLRHAVERLPRRARRDQSFPDLRLAFHDRVLAHDGATGCWYASAAPLSSTGWTGSAGSTGSTGSKIDWLRRVLDDAGSAAQASPPPAPRTADRRAQGNELRANMTRDEYLRAVRRVVEYIAAGDIYQANFTQRFEGRVACAAADLYLGLRRRNPAPFAAYLDCGEGRAVLSSSPERFLKLRGRDVETRPIKGTRPRGSTPDDDPARAEELMASAKDAAELAMIVDLERNDLGRVAEYGSVRVAEARALEAYPTVFHLVATVTGRLAGGKDGVDLLKAAFPGGSITGAPKVRAMEIIDELEPTARSVYTGAMGYIDLSGDLDLSIVIRTILYDNGRVTYQTGGGIVADSDPEAEYAECLAKGRALDEAIWDAGGTP